MTFEPEDDNSLLARARRMRREPQPAEALLWDKLRRKRLQVKFRRQYVLGGYILDLCCLRPKLAIELDGKQHEEPDAIQYDRMRTAYLEGAGFHELRFVNSEVLQKADAVVERIGKVVESLLRSPSP
jgi:very-short-patch-repair endonuclease